MSRLNFKLEAVASKSRARATRFKTLHGEVTTPVFMPVGTQATVKAQTRETLTETGAQVLLANTYHLLLRPGIEVFQKMGGIHSFMHWDKAVLTDSGGFQIYSLPHSRELTDEGAKFKSYVDGKLILLSPEASIGMQRAIGSDIMMVLDQCVPSTSEKNVAIEAMNRTHRWAARSLKARGDSPQSMFAIVQGACFPDLRKQSADQLTQMGFDGFAIGGLAVGESKEIREDFTELSAELLPKELPRYLMGVGTPIDILEAVHRGVDMFDCILPTALAQRGVAFTSHGKLQLRRSVYKFADSKLDTACTCRTCAVYSRAYLHHLIKTEEHLGWHLIGLHNLHFYKQLTIDMRKHILGDTFYDYYLETREVLQQADAEFPAKTARPRKAKKATALQLGDYEVHESTQGFNCIKQRSSGEIMHSVNNPSVEAHRLYVEQSQLANRLRQTGEPELVIWDVGLGAATNAMSVLECCEKLAAEGAESFRPVHLISFENDLDSLKLALKHPTRFPHLRHAAPHALLKDGFWQATEFPFRWTLLTGDFFATLSQAAVPDLIFYDPFSYKTDAKLWSLECFQRLYGHCENQATELFTYSASTAVRAGLLGAGFYVAQGVATGPKAETTIALTSPARHLATLSHALLGLTWLERWARSGARYPLGLSAGDESAFERKLAAHAQLIVAVE
jgi:queuine tRNA-ribosyltransferase